MFERFTRQARETVIAAQDEARRLQHRRIGSEHLLLALTRGEDGDAARAALADVGITHGAAEAQVLRISGGPELDGEALAAMGIDLGEIRRRAEAQFGLGALDEEEELPRRRRWPSLHELTGGIPFGDDAKTALESALREAAALRDRQIGSGHILLGMLRGHGLGVRVLEALDVRPELLRSRLMLRMRTSA